MRVDCALLCDAVTVREGLLHILGGGVTRINRPEYPAPMGLALALLIDVHPTEIDRPHVAQVLVLGADGQRLFEMQLQFGLEAPPPDMPPGEHFPLPLPVPLHTVPIPSEGAYSVEVLIDGNHQKAVSFHAVIVAPQPGELEA